VLSIAACPSGYMSNVSVCLTRANVLGPGRVRRVRDGFFWRGFRYLSPPFLFSNAFESVTKINWQELTTHE
jgi:hypothetical protein